MQKEKNKDLLEKVLWNFHKFVPNIPFYCFLFQDFFLNEVKEKAPSFEKNQPLDLHRNLWKIGFSLRSVGCPGRSQKPNFHKPKMLCLRLDSKNESKRKAIHLQKLRVCGWRGLECFRQPFVWTFRCLERATGSKESPRLFLGCSAPRKTSRSGAKQQFKWIGWRYSPWCPKRMFRTKYLTIQWTESYCRICLPYADRSPDNDS